VRNGALLIIGLGPTMWCLASGHIKKTVAVACDTLEVRRQ